jgi:hypothetical protein
LATRPKDALARARRALSLTSEFDPIVFVKAGRKGEVVEVGCEPRSSSVYWPTRWQR